MRTDNPGFGEMSTPQILLLAREFARAVRAFDFERLTTLYRDDIVIWHNYDEVAQTKEQGLRSLAWVQRRTRGYGWDEIRIDPLPDGYVQRHTTCAEEPALAVPTMMRVWCKGDQIVRIEHYLDSVRFAPLLS